ncbi:GntR family transcriptional regulator [Streptomyces sp. CC228A]|uniref:GntR family transcriptional regulator n=1 Tax=Streptomyces sp. CC228A TaxID=2898186 RepID=UPI001F28EAFD|nr:GntR family transcriptional regulator [Streptomyces sp. CC228A]
MTTVGNVVAGDDDVQGVRRWVRLSCTEPGTHLPALAEIAGDLRLSTAVVRSALEQLAAEGMVTLHEGHRLYSVGTTTPAERAYRLMRPTRAWPAARPRAVDDGERVPGRPQPSRA